MTAAMTQVPVPTATLDQIIKSAEFLKALSMSVEVGEYKGWTVRVSLEKPDSKLKDMHVI